MTIPRVIPYKQCIASNIETKTAVKYFMSLCTASVKEYWRDPSERHDEFAIHDGKMMMMLNSVLNYTKISKSERAVMKKLTPIIE